MIFDIDSYVRIIDNLYDGLYYVDKDRIIRYWNKAAENISGFKASEVIGRPCSDNILTHVDSDGNNLCEGMCPLAMTISDSLAHEAEVFLHHKDGHRVPVSIRATVLTDADNNVIGGVELFNDISNKKLIEARVKELEQMALLDNLTKLANRNYIEKELHVCFEELKRFNMPFGILFMDIDDFKKVNDKYGHDTGDIVLKFVADTLVKNSRPFDVVGRWGGEEFLVIVRNVDGKTLEHLGNRLRILIENSYISVGKKKLNTSISIGATVIRENDNKEIFLRRADVLLYESKKAGKNCLTLG